jgi:hypothetical protein
VTWNVFECEEIKRKRDQVKEQSCKIWLQVLGTHRWKPALIPAFDNEVGITW